MNNQDIETRIQILEEIEAVKRLRYTYCYLCDEYKMDQVVALFTEDAVADFHEFGKYNGREEIAKFYKEIVPSAMTFFVHMVSNPMIDIIDMEHAKGKWYADVPATLSNEARWMCGRYEEEYIKQKGEWKFKVMKFFWFYVTPFDKGWVRERLKM